jgi:hypothetical protein
MALSSLSFSCSENNCQISLSTLLDEMVSIEETARYPAIPYRAFSLSGRAEKILFDKPGPGVITRIRLASEDKQGIVRFYFDGSSSEEIVLPAYGFSQLNIPEAEGGLLTASGSALYLPIPYNKHCRITFEEVAGAESAPQYYQINYRQYPEGTSVETFSLQKASRMKQRIAEVNHLLQASDPALKTESIREGNVTLEGGNPIVIKLPQGENAVYGLRLQITTPAKADQYAQQMRNVILQGIFDGKLTVRAPVSDFSGGGIGAPAVASFYLSADGKGGLFSRWLMPYREKALLSLINEGKERLGINYTIYVSPMAWDEERSLYFHASWKEELGLNVSSSKGNEWNFAAISGGKGVYKGDVLTFYNHTTGWYGDGEVEIRVDKDSEMPSYTENSIGDYYNLQPPPETFHTPFGGAPRAGLKSSYGYNTLLRTRILDDIPFANRFRLDMKLLGRKAGTVDFATTIFWYGDRKTRPEKISRSEVWARTLLPSPEADSEEP